MILKALCDYYDRNKDKLPSFGLELKEIAFLIVIDEEGRFIRLEDRRVDQKHAQAFMVKKQVKRSRNIAANFFYDNSAYVFGYTDKDSDPEPCLNAFKTRVQETCELAPDNRKLQAVSKFYCQSKESILESLQKDALWEDVSKNLNKKYSTFSFKLDGDTKIVAEDTDILELVKETGDGDSKRCLITGEKLPIVRLTSATMIPGSQATATLVSFQTGSGYDSYGKSQAFNAPISQEAEFKYTTALKSMLDADSRHKFLFGTRTFVFWSSQDNEAGHKIEEGIFELFGFRGDEAPENSIEQVRKTFLSVYNGTLKTSLGDKFFILGLAPNSARIAVSYWAEIPLKVFAKLILRHFDDMTIDDTRKDKKPYYGLYTLMSATTATGKAGDASPNLAEQLVKSIFEGLPYPFALYMGVLNRVRAGQSAVSITQAAIIKAYLNRLLNNNDKLKVMLDKENTNQGYLCGRLFAVLDKIQQDANGINSIRERYMNSASATPAAVFATILNLSSHHAEKLNPGTQVYYERIKQEIIDKIAADGFPAHLDLQDQGRFFVGYYHQRQDLFKPKADGSEEQEQATEQD